MGYRFASAPHLPQLAWDSAYSKENFEVINKSIEDMRVDYKKKAQVLVNGLNKIGFKVDEIDGGMFVMIDCKKLTGMNGLELSHYL